MYNTSGVDAIATITELRSKTSELIEHVRQHQQGVLIQKNNEPHAVLLDWKTYQRVMGNKQADAKERDRPPRQRARQSTSGAEQEPTSSG
ncbi:MAG: type II toxin-antitoxin system prevent-host-death family antitoxin [Bacteroidetes bacterium QH_2_67_10]|nr:MAG: type II toxin-antitoxin system prevent-host-death family antitoxin [Bacteroidetes bacterium QH_2_67_10]